MLQEAKASSIIYTGLFSSSIKIIVFAVKS